MKRKKTIMPTMLPSDVLAFLAELEEFATSLIEKYHNLSEVEGGDRRQFQYYTPMTVEIRTSDVVLARFMEEGIDIYPDDK